MLVIRSTYYGARAVI